MTDDQVTLARRAVVCKHWRWMPGMLAMSDPERVPRVVGSPVWPSEMRARVTGVVLGRWHGVGQYCIDHPDVEHESMSGDDLPGTLPDLTDPATLGCLLALVREAWDDPTLCCRITDGRIGGPDGPFAWEFNGRIKHGWGWRTEAETLVAALEAAP